MKKSLLATVAAVALIAGPGVVAAQSSKDKEPAAKPAASETKGGAEMNKNADRSAQNKGKAETSGAGSAEMNKGADSNKAGAQMKGQAQSTGAGSEMKSDNKADTGSKAQTTGQGSSEQKAAPAGRSATEKSGTTERSGATTQQSGTTNRATSGGSSTAPAAQSPQAQGTAQTQGAQTGASVSLTNEQRSQIRVSVLQSGSAPKISRSEVNFNISVGTVVPRTIRFVTVPETIVRIQPAWRGYLYFVVDDEIIIVEPRTHKIVAVLTV